MLIVGTLRQSIYFKKKVFNNGFLTDITEMELKVDVLYAFLMLYY